ncbi:PEP7 [Sanghuangporus sanghuang]
MSTTSPTPYVPYQAYKPKRHSRVLSNPTPPAEVLPNGFTDLHNQTRHVSSSSFDSATKANIESNAKVVSALRNDVAPSAANDPETPYPFAKSSSGPSSRPVSVVIMPEQLAGKDMDMKPSSERASPTDTVSSVTGIRLNGEPLESTSDANTEPSSPASVQSAPIATNARPMSSSSGVNGKASTMVKLSEKSAGKAPAVSSDDGPPTSPTSPISAKSTFRNRRTSTFRYVPLRPPNASSSSTPRTSSPLRPTSTQAHSHNRAASTSGLSPLSNARLLGDQPSPLQTASRSPASVHSDLSPETAHSTLLNPIIRDVNNNTHHRSTSVMIPPSISPQPRLNPPQRTSSLPPPPAPPPKPISPSLSPSPGPGPGPASSAASQSISATSSRVQSPSLMPHNTPSFSTSSTTSIPSTPTSTGTYKAVYRPGFQPKGVYRPLTDEFLALRKRARDRGRIELTRLERRFEKLVDLHFSPPKSGEEDAVMKGREKSSNGSGVMAPGLARRASSFFEDLGDLKGKSATELWRSVLESRAAAANGGKGDIRSAEQRITPWQDDAEVSACPHCSASFHPLTNRKHHCRLCGRIICSLPVKNPQRPIPCSLLFVSDPKTGRIEEVTEGVDYGVRPRARVDSKVGKTGGGVGQNEEKFLKGVRICRECKPVMLRQQYRQEAKRVPAMVRLYEALISLESEIEETLPQFQELMLSLSNNPDEAPTKEASAARKHLLECFADYDAIAKRIRKIPCPGGPGSSQDRVQAAIVARANMFLQKNMFPLQSLPKLKKRSSTNVNGDALVSDSAPSQVIDPDSELARVLQPLLEQEALLESFVEEATTHRKFEDARTLKANLAEIRAEIDRIVIQAEGGV